MASKDKKKTILLVMVFMIILLAALISYSIAGRIRGAGAEVGPIEVSIDGNYANVTVGLDTEPDIDEKDMDVRLRSNEDEIPLVYDGKSIRGTLNEREFTNMIEKDEVNITGNIDVPIIGPFKINRDLEETINISFIHELSSSMSVENVSVEFSLFYTVIVFDFRANVSRDFQINITDTDAVVTSPSGTFNSEVLELNYRTDETGNARVRLPLLGALGLALNSRNIMIESWGISVMVDIPLFNG